jgi:hypothetical protein
VTQGLKTHEAVSFRATPLDHPLDCNYTRWRLPNGIDALPQEIWDQDVIAADPTGSDWLAPGLLARAHGTLRTGLLRTGKTGRFSLPLARRPQRGTRVPLPRFVLGYRKS